MKVESFLRQEAKRMGSYVEIDGKKIPMIQKIPITDQPSATDLARSDEKIHVRTESNRATSFRSAQNANRGGRCM